MLEEVRRANIVLQRQLRDLRDVPALCVQPNAVAALCETSVDGTLKMLVLETSRLNRECAVRAKEVQALHARVDLQDTRLDEQEAKLAEMQRTLDLRQYATDTESAIVKFINPSLLGAPYYVATVSGFKCLRACAIKGRQRDYKLSWDAIMSYKLMGDAVHQAMNMRWRFIKRRVVDVEGMIKLLKIIKPPAACTTCEADGTVAAELRESERLAADAIDSCTKIRDLILCYRGLSESATEPGRFD